MLSRNNFNEKLRQMSNQRDHFSIRKLTIGAASVLIGITFIGLSGQTVNADEVSGNTQPEITQVEAKVADDTTQDSSVQEVSDNTPKAGEAQADSKVEDTSKVETEHIGDAKTEMGDQTKSAEPVKTADAGQTTTQDEQEAQVPVPETPKAPDTTEQDQTQKDQTSEQTEDLDVKKDTENSQTPATNENAENVQKTAKKEVKENPDEGIAPQSETNGEYNVADWDGSLDETTHEYTLNNYRGTDKENIYIPNTQDFINAGKISNGDKVYITKDLMQTITRNGAVSITVDDQGEKNKVYAKGNWDRAFLGSDKLKSVDLSHVDTSGVTSMSAMFQSDGNLESLNLSNCDLSNVTNANGMFNWAGGKLKNVNLTGTIGVTRDLLGQYVGAANRAGDTVNLGNINLASDVTSLDHLFYNMTNIKHVNFGNLDVSHIDDMSYMFYGESNLESIDFSGLTFKDGVNTTEMFSYTDNLKSVNLTGTKNVNKDILKAYIAAAQRKDPSTVDLSGINLAPSVTDLSGLFRENKNIKHVDLSGLDISHVTNMSSMFSGASNLESVDFSNLDFAKINTNGMFNWTSNKLKTITLTNTKNVTRDILGAYVGAAKNGGDDSIDLSGISLSSKVTDLSGLFKDMTNFKSVDLSGLDLSHVTNLSNLFHGASNLTDVDFSNTVFNPDVNTDGIFNDIKLQNVKVNGAKNINQGFLKGLVNAFKNGKAKTIDLSDITFAQDVTSFKGLFADMPDVETIKLNNWNTSNITDMSFMFNNDPKLTTIEGLENWNTHNVTDMAYMFAGIYNPTKDEYAPIDLESIGHLTSLNLSNWDTSNVTNMMFMFAGQTYITNLGDLSTRGNKWNTSKVTNMAGMFNDLENLPDNVFDLTGWDTSNVEDMTRMFHSMCLQENMDFVNDWKTGKVTDMSDMFSNDKLLKNLDLSNWDVSSVGLKNTEQNYSLAGMFAGDISLTSVGDLSKWGDKTKNVHDTRQMFLNTPNLINIDLSGWNTDKLQIAEGMFEFSGAKHINLDGWDFSHIKRITRAGYVEGNPNPSDEPLLRGVENMFKHLRNKAVISMNGIVLPDAKNAFEINDFISDAYNADYQAQPIIVIANGKDGEELQNLLAVNNQTWTNKAGETITGRQNSDYITYVRTDDNSEQIGYHGLNFIFTSLDALHDYFDDVTKTSAVKTALGNDLYHDWDAKIDTENGVVKNDLRLYPGSSYDPYNDPIHAEKDGYILVDLMTSKYQLHIVDPTPDTETKDPTRTIIIENPDGTTRTEKQTVEFTRTVTKHVDGYKEYTEWTPASGNWDHFDVPQHDGYDSYIDGVAGTSISAESINADTANVTVHVTYKSNTPDTPDNPTPDNPEPEKPKPEVPDTPDEPNEPEKPTVPKDNDHNKSDESENTRPKAEDKNKSKKGSKAQNAGVHGQTAPRAATAPNRLIAPKGETLPNDNGLKKLSTKPASAAKANANKKETLPQTGEKKDDIGLLGIGLLVLAGLGFVDRKRRN